MTPPRHQPIQALLVGAHFRPPAKQLLAALPAGTPCQLIPEPDNPYDADAVKVLLPLSSLPDPDGTLSRGLEHALEGTGITLDDLLAAGEPIHLGYLPTSTNKQHLKSLQDGLSLSSNQGLFQTMQDRGQEPPWSARLAFAPDGSPMVQCQTPNTSPPALNGLPDPRDENIYGDSDATS